MTHPKLERLKKVASPKHPPPPDGTPLERWGPLVLMIAGILIASLVGTGQVHVYGAEEVLTIILYAAAGYYIRRVEDKV